jgi:hypothetical protein
VAPGRAALDLPGALATRHHQYRDRSGEAVDLLRRRPQDSAALAVEGVQVVVTSRDQDRTVTRHDGRPAASFSAGRSRPRELQRRNVGRAEHVLGRAIARVTHVGRTSAGRKGRREIGRPGGPVWSPTTRMTSPTTMMVSGPFHAKASARA